MNWKQLAVWRSQTGATLLELLVAVTIFVVVGLCSAVLYTTVLQTYAKDKITQDLQREGDAIMAHMSRNLKEATTLVTNSGSTLTVTIPPKTGYGTQRMYFLSNSKVTYRSEALSPTDEDLMQPGTTATALSYTTTLDGQNLKSIRINTTLSKTKGKYTVTLPITTTIITRPQ